MRDFLWYFFRKAREVDIREDLNLVYGVLFEELAIVGRGFGFLFGCGGGDIISHNGAVVIGR
jgi:hypothetical protein